MTKEKLLYILTGTDAPKNVNEREHFIIDECLKLINTNMRELLLARLSLIKEKEFDFSKNLMRWREYKLFDMPIQEIKFDTLSDTDLLKGFEQIVKTVSKQM